MLIFIGSQRTISPRTLEIEWVIKVGQPGLRTCRPAGYESAYFTLWSSLTNCSLLYGTKTCVLELNEESCYQMG